MVISARTGYKSLFLIAPLNHFKMNSHKLRTTNSCKESDEALEKWPNMRKNEISLCLAVTFPGMLLIPFGLAYFERQ